MDCERIARYEFIEKYIRWHLVPGLDRVVDLQLLDGTHGLSLFETTPDAEVGSPLERRPSPRSRKSSFGAPQENGSHGFLHGAPQPWRERYLWWWRLQS